MALIGFRVDALAVAARLGAERAGLPAGAAVIGIEIECGDAFPAGAAALGADQFSARPSRAELGAPVAAFTAMARVGLQLIDTDSEAARLEGGATHVPTDLIPDRAEDTHAFPANLVGGTDGAARSAVVAIGLEVDASAVAAVQTGVAGGIAGTTVAFVRIEIEALAAALVATALAPALAAPALRAVAAIGVPIAVLANLLAGRGIAHSLGHQECAECSSEKGFAGAAARRRERPCQGVEAGSVHGCSVRETCGQRTVRCRSVG
jgi:hypothetical protein